MAMLLLLSVLASFLSQHGTSANSGSIVSKGGLDKFYLSSKEALQHGLEIHLKELPPLSGPTVQVSIDVLIVESLGVTLMPSWGLEITVCKHSLPLLKVTLSVSLCSKIRLRGGLHHLSLDDCSVDFAEIRAEDLSLQIQLPRAALIDLLGGPASCDGVPKSPPPVPSCSLPHSGVLDADILLYTSSVDITRFLASMQMAKIFDKEMTLDSLTTTTIKENFPEVDCPRDYPAIVQIVCTDINIDINPSGVVLGFVFRVTTGYEEPGTGFVPLLHFVLTGKFVVHATINCQAKLVLLSVSTSSEFQIVGSCARGPCTIDNNVVEKVFPLRTWCKDILNVGLKEKFHFFLPKHFSCDVCDNIIYLQGCVYFSCLPHFVW